MAKINTMILSAGSQAVYAEASDNFTKITHAARIGKCIRSYSGQTLYINSAFCNWMGTDISLFNANTKIDLVSSPLNPYLSHIEQLEKQVFSDRMERMCIFSIIPSSGGKRTLCSMRFIFCESENGQPGCLWVWQDYYCLNMLSGKIQSRARGKKDKRWESPFDVVTVKEWAVIWPLLFGYRRSVIARLLGVTLKHINRIINRVLVKAGFNNAEQLVEELLLHGFDQIIPESHFFIIKGDQ